MPPEPPPIPGRSYSSQSSSSPEENREREEPRKFKAGDRVRISGQSSNIDDWLQKDNRVGTVVSFSVNNSKFYWVQMDKPAILEVDGWDGGKRPSIIPQGYAFFALLEEMELIELVKPQKPFDIDQWRKNLKPGDKVRVCKDQADITTGALGKWKGSVVTFKKRSTLCWAIEEFDGWWNACRFEPVKKSQSSESREIKEKKQPLDPQLKNLIQTASELIRVIETTFKDSKKYPIFGINLAKQEAVEKTRKSNLGESLLSLGVVLYHLYAGQSEHNNHSYLLDGYPKPEDMPEGFWRVIDKLLKSEHRSLDEFKEDLKQLKKVLKEGVVEDLGKREESIENQGAKKIWQTQVDRLIELGYREALNMTEEDFANPDLIPLPDPEMKNPILVVPVDALGARKQMELIEVDGRRGCCRFEVIENTIRVSCRVYWIDLIQDGGEYLDKLPNECLEAFSDNERGLTIAEGIALIAQYPQTLKHHNIDLIGSHRHPDKIPTIWLDVNDMPSLILTINTPNPEWGAPSCRCVPQEKTNKDSS